MHRGRAPQYGPPVTASDAEPAPGRAADDADADGYFGEPVAAEYDDPSSHMFTPAAIDPAADFLAELAGDGRALELGIGTGRIALPLAGRGVEVHGIDMSRAMVARLRAKQGGDAIGVTIGDFSATTGRDDGRGLLRRLPRLQHDHEPDLAGGAGGVLPQCRGAPGARRDLRRRGHGARAAQAAARPERRALPHEPDPLGLRRVRRRHPGDQLELRRGGGRPSGRTARFRSGTCGRPSST